MTRMKMSEHQEMHRNEKLGTLYLEGRIVPGYNHEERRTQEGNLEMILSSYPCSLKHGEDVVENCDMRHLLLLHPRDAIQELRIVEAQRHQGPELEPNEQYCTNRWVIKVNLYELYGKGEKSEVDNEESQKADVTHLPNIKFDKQWERLMYEGDWKDTMANMATNLVIPTNTQETRDRCPLILLHGPAGTGKTTFAQSLAQKLSIRLSSHFLVTKLFEVRTAMLFSRKFGESARFVDEVFVKIRNASEEDDQALVIVLIDEVESIAGSRQTAMEMKEAQDGCKATNALLTHLDKMKSCKNVLLIGTTNFPDSLDAAFLDRCICRTKIDLPKRKTQYEILRKQVQELIYRGAILSKVNFPGFAEAQRVHRAKESENPAFRLYNLLETVRSVNKEGTSSMGLSGRYLASLPSNALDMFKRGTIPDLDDAFGFFEKYATLELGAPCEDEDSDSDSPEDEEVEGKSENGGNMQMQISSGANLDRSPEIGNKKRNYSALIIEGSLQKIEEVTRELKRRGINLRRKLDNVGPNFGNVYTHNQI